MAPCKRRWKLAALVAALLVTLALVVFLFPTTVTLTVSGPPGTGFRGFVEVDGVRHEVAGQVPAEFRFKGRRIAYLIKRLDGPATEMLVVGERINGRDKGCGCGPGGVAGGLVVEGPGLLAASMTSTWAAGIGFDDGGFPVRVRPDGIAWGDEGPAVP